MLGPNLMQYCKKSGCPLHCVRSVKLWKAIFCYLNEQIVFRFTKYVKFIKVKTASRF